MIVYGVNPVMQALRAGRVRKLRVGARSDRRIEEAIALARTRRVPVERVDAAALERAARGGVHQGVVADVDEPREYAIGDLVAAAAPGAPLLVVLDGVEDPQNVGAILRTVDAAGAHGVVRQERHAAPLDGAAAKASAGAVASVRIATVVNIARALEELKDARCLDRRPRGRCVRALRLGRHDGAYGNRPWRRGRRAAAAGARSVRPARGAFRWPARWKA